MLAANRRPLYCTLRTRKRCAVLDNNGQLKRVHHILNECVVDRCAQGVDVVRISIIKLHYASQVIVQKQ